METRNEIIERISAELKAANTLAGAQVYTADEEVLEQGDLPALTVAWENDRVDDVGTLADDGSEVQARRMQVVVAAVALTAATVTDLADQAEAALLAAFPECDFVEAQIARTQPEDGETIVYTVRSEFSLQYGKAVHR